MPKDLAYSIKCGDILLDYLQDTLRIQTWEEFAEARAKCIRSLDRLGFFSALGW